MVASHVQTSAIGNQQRLNEALRRFDEENARDPNVINLNNETRPRELVYAERLTDWVTKLTSAPSEALLLAARCQHICRWKIPRQSYEMTRSGYLRWREELKKFHSNVSAEILREVGYPEETITRVRDLNLKRNLSDDPECQTLEDALCLVTLQYQLTELIIKNDSDKVVSILRKTWKKMSPQAREHALTLPFSAPEKELVRCALETPEV